MVTILPLYACFLRGFKLVSKFKLIYSMNTMLNRKVSVMKKKKEMHQLLCS